MTPPRPDRRVWIGSLAFGAVAGGVDGRDPAEPVTAATVGEAQKLIGLSFGEDERARIAARTGEALKQFEGLRRAEIPNGLAPAADYRLPPDPRVRSRRGVDLLPASPPARPDSSLDLHFAPVHVLARLLRDRQISSVELTRAALGRLESLDSVLHAVITLTAGLALEQAAAADREIAAGRWRGPLHGIPFGLKDLFAVRGHPTTWGAKPFREQVIDEDAAVYERLRSAGAVLCAKLSVGALAMGDLWFGGRTRNPWNPEQGSSGSSAGSAAAVAAGALPFAIGTETLGSIVSPCTRCGATGLRPTFGRISRHGAMALCWSMDKAGPIARSARDAALVFDALRGADPRDPSTFEATFDCAPAATLAGRRVAYVPAHFEGGRAASDRAVLEDLGALGAELVPVELPGIDAGPLSIILDVEAAAAFDALTRDGRVADLDGQGPQDWPDAFRRARFVPAVEFVQATRLRRRLAAAWSELLAPVDALVAPSHRGGTLLPTNLSGHPAVVLPHGFGERGPTSITFVGAAAQEGPLLEVAIAWQESKDWHLRRPPLGG